MVLDSNGEVYEGDLSILDDLVGFVEDILDENPGGRRLSPIFGFPLDIEDLLELLDPESFCYDLDTCEVEYACVDDPGTNASTCTGSQSCSVEVPEVVMADYDPREICEYPLKEGPSLELMWQEVDQDFRPEQFVDNVQEQFV
jgi:hypothetical protein